MDWIFEHFRLIVIVGGAIAYWLNQRRKAKEEEEAARTVAPSTPNAPVDDEAERIRRVQEEIRRKILERIGGAPRTVSAPPPLKTAPEPTPWQDPTPLEKYTDSQAEDERVAAADQAMLDRQLELAAKLRQLKEQRREHDRPADVFAEQTTLALSASQVAVRGSVLADLRDPLSARRAMVLREVLGTPVGLR